MKTLNPLPLVTVLVFASWFSSCELLAHANQITYLWEGHLEPSGTEDPWQLGADGEPFEMQITVLRNATDLQPDPDVQFAVFQVEQVRLLLNGQDATYIDEGVLDFTDDGIIPLDFLFFGGNFERFGATIEISSSVAVPQDTFQFASLIELPPIFGPTTNNSKIGTGSGGPYNSVVEANAPVQVVPEPVSLVLFALGLPVILGHVTGLIHLRLEMEV